jgi:tryptophan 7-halogenase
MSASRLSRLAIVGRDVDLWLSACVLRRALAPSGLEIVAVELPSMIGPADFNATQPALEALHNQIGIDEAGLLRLAGGSFTLGQNFTEPEGRAVPFMLAHGAYGRPIEGRDFFAYWLKGRRFGLDVALEEFSPTAVAARHGRLLIPDDVSDGFGRCDYGYHLPTAGHAAVLRNAAARLGVRIVDGSDVDVETEGDAIAAVIADGERIVADLFIDAAGADGDLIGALGRDDRVDWSSLFPVDSLIVGSARRLDPVPVYADIRATPSGWTGLFPAAGATFVLHAFDSAETSDEDAMRDAVAVGGLALTDATISALRSGRRGAAWRSNCVALGAAAASFDPIHGVDLHALQQGLVKLLGCFPATTDFAAQRAEYNRSTAAVFDHIRDFQAAHYRLAPHAGTFWERSRAMPLPPELAHRIATFRARGEIAPWEEDSFPPDSWRALFIGHGVMPDSWSPTIDRTEPAVMREAFGGTLAAVRQQVLRQPTHDAQLAAIGRRDAR